MTFYTVRDLRSSPRKVWQRLSEAHEVVITNNGKPTALMIEVDDENLEEIRASLRQSLTMRAVNRLRLRAAASGKEALSEAEIDAEIKKARRAKRS